MRDMRVEPVLKGILEDVGSCQGSGPQVMRDGSDWELSLPR